MEFIVQKLDGQVAELSDFANLALVRQETISGWSVGQHIEHSLIAISGMILALRKEHPGTGDRAANQYREAVMKSKEFPRGAIEAPAISRPSEDPSQEFLSRLILKTRSRLRNPLDISEEATLIHPIMDVMYRDEALEFMTIHTEHHLKIIRELVRADSGR